MVYSLPAKHFHLGIILLPRGHMVISEDIFDPKNLGGCYWRLVSRGWGCF